MKKDLFYGLTNYTRIILASYSASWYRLEWPTIQHPMHAHIHIIWTFKFNLCPLNTNN